MRQPELTETLQSLVRRHGISSVLHGLADIQSSIAPPASSLPPRRARASAKGKQSAVEYVEKMALPQEKAKVMAKAAERFEDKRFLPAVADIREFCRVHDLQISNSTSRTAAIPRIFSFLAATDTSDLIMILDDSNFCGPARLAPIADAIRNYSDRSTNPATPHEPRAKNP